MATSTRVLKSSTKIEMSLYRETNSEWYWRLRFLRAELLIEQNRSKEALSLLDIDRLSEARYPSLAITRRLLNARIHLRQSRFEDASQLLREAGQLAHRYANPELLTEVELLRGQLRGRQGNIPDAENAFSEAHEISLATHDQYRQAQALNGRGMLLMLRSRCDEAIPFFEQSRMMSEALGADLRTAGAANNLGMCYGQLGDFERAISYREQAMKLARPSARLSEHPWGDRYFASCSRESEGSDPILPARSDDRAGNSACCRKQQDGRAI